MFPGGLCASETGLGLSGRLRVSSQVGGGVGLTLWGMEWVEASWPETVSSHRSRT